MGKDYLKEGLFFVNKSQLDEAEKVLREGMELFPNDEKILNLLGWVLYQRGKYQDMVELYKRLVKLNPQQSFTLFYNLGRAYFQLKDYQSAINAFHKTLEIVPEHKNALFYLSTSYEKLGDIKSSKKYLSKLIKKGNLDEQLKDVSMQEGITEYNVDELLDYLKSPYNIERQGFTKASLFGLWSINKDFLLLWPKSICKESYIEHVVFKGEGRVVFKGRPLIECQKTMKL